MEGHHVRHLGAHQCVCTSGRGRGEKDVTCLKAFTGTGAIGKGGMGEGTAGPALGGAGSPTRNVPSGGMAVGSRPESPRVKQEAEAPGVPWCPAGVPCRNSHLEINPKFRQTYDNVSSLCQSWSTVPTGGCPVSLSGRCSVNAAESPHQAYKPHEERRIVPGVCRWPPEE